MRVSSKIISGFLILMLLGLVVLANQLSLIHKMQLINRDLSEINMNSAITVLRMRELTDVLNNDSRKYFAVRDSIYENLINESRQDLLDDLARLQKTVRSAAEREATAKLAAALDDYWRVLMFSSCRMRRIPRVCRPTSP